MSGGGTIRRRGVTVKELHKRFKKAILYDPDLTYAQIKVRFGFSYEKARKLREEAMEEGK